MKQQLINKSFKLSENEIYYLKVLKEKYNIKPNYFVRQSIIEKLKRDIPKIREQNKIKLPF